MLLIRAAVLLACSFPLWPQVSEQPGVNRLVKRQFESLCGPCHGADGRGGERGPSIFERQRAHLRTETELRDLIRSGIPSAGMPGFPLPDAKLVPLARFVHDLTAPAAENPPAGDAAAGQRFFFGAGGCSGCHMVDGRGGTAGPDLSQLGLRFTAEEITDALLHPDRRVGRGYVVATVRLKDGRSLRGLARNESSYDLQLQTMDGRLHVLRSDQVAEIKRENKSIMPALNAAEPEMSGLLAYLTRLARNGPFRGTPRSDADNPVRAFHEIAAPQPGAWPTYHGQLGGNRHSPLRDINTGNVSGLAPRWVFSIGSSQKLEVTPVVVEGIMYVTAVNEAYALDAGTGREIWHFQRPRTPGLVGDASGGINRGVALLGDRVFLVTDNAHLLALDRWSGHLLWETEMADSRENYGATSAPLVVKNMVVSGTSGGDEGVRGFVAAYDAITGERLWRFWAAPLRDEPAAKTWEGRALEHGCSSMWLTGTYDPGTDLLYWTTGNPCPDFNGDERKGDNLYSDSVVALKPETGELRWYFQFTPHDLHDWDAAETPMLVDAEWQGRTRKLLLQSNRNGFFYVLDRTNGEFLRATPFVERLNWASGIGPDGRPKVLPGTDPTPEGVKVCPSIEGGSNWMSTAYNPDTGLFYVMALESCNIYTKSAAVWQAGESYYGGGTRRLPDEPGQKVLRAIDLRTGKISWEHPQVGTADSWGGVLSTAGGLVFFCDDSGAFAAAEARTGKPLWHFHTSQLWKASPMTYSVDGRQYVAVAAGANILAFALPN
jgi:alcohol dehydrogenase (cytochrome c)